MTTTLEKQLDKDINGTRIWSYPCCYMVDGIDDDIWRDIRWNLVDISLSSDLDEILFSVPELNLLVEDSFKVWEIYHSKKTKDFLTEVYNTIDTFEGFVIFRRS